jgi:hypothetical protein
MDNLQEQAEPAIMDGSWFIDEQRNFYIVPLDPEMENTGPDNAIMDALNKACRENGGVLPEDFDYEALGLSIIGDKVKRWNAIDGYYYA